MNIRFTLFNFDFDMYKDRSYNMDVLIFQIGHRSLLSFYSDGIVFEWHILFFRFNHARKLNNI